MKRFITAIWNFVHPNKPGGFNGVTYAILCVALMGLFGAQQLGVTSRVGDFITGNNNGVCDCSAPPQSVFHLTGSNWTVHSYYPWDSGILGTAAVDDMDYGLGYGVSEPARLPGASWITYRYIASGKIIGSGNYVVFATPNGGRFAYFHLLWYEWRAIMRGGDQVGVTGWPTSDIYSGGGPSGPADAHLCVGVDYLGKAWLMDGVNHPPKKPAPKFLAKRWYHYLDAHHRKHSKWAVYRVHKHLIWSASIWRYHQRKLGGILRAAKWTAGPKAHPARGFTKTSFQGGGIYTWPHSHSSKIVFWKHWTK